MTAPLPTEIKAASAPNPTKEMHLLDHLAELRTRLVVIALAVTVGACLAYTFAGEIFRLLSAPFDQAFTKHELIGTGPAEAFIMKLKLSLFAGGVMASPVVFYQIWLFVAPGLHQHEKRLALPFLVSTTALFLSGILFCYYVALPYAYGFFFDQYTSLGVMPNIKIGEHLSFVVKMMLVFGAMFELPVLAYFLGRLGIITADFLIRGTRYAIVIIFIVSAILTPPDVITQLLMALPLMVLYGISIVVVRYSARKQQ